jgi:hypothetical protein
LVARQGTVTGIKTKFNAVKGEMANIFKRSGATDTEIKAWNDTITDPTTATPSSWKSFIDGSLQLMGSRIEALRNTYEQGMGKTKDFAFLSPRSRTILSGLGVDVNAIDPVGEIEGQARSGKLPPIESFGGNLEKGTPSHTMIPKEEWLLKAKAIPGNSGVSDAELSAEYDRKYGRK